jgi:hypothetical protein
MSSIPSYQAGKNIGTLLKLATDPIVSQQQAVLFNCYLPCRMPARLVSAENSGHAFIIKCDSVDSLRDIAYVLNELTTIAVDTAAEEVGNVENPWCIALQFACDRFGSKPEIL